MTPGGLLFEAITPLAFSIEVTRERWNLIVSVKHPVMNGHEDDVRAAMERRGTIPVFAVMFPPKRRELSLPHPNASSADRCWRA